MHPADPTPAQRPAQYRRPHLPILTAASLLMLSAAGVQAATITVNGSGNFSSTTVCTLRDAIIAANRDTATGACPAGSGADTLVLPSGMTTTISGSTSFGCGFNRWMQQLGDIVLQGSDS